MIKNGYVEIPCDVEYHDQYIMFRFHMPIMVDAGDELEVKLEDGIPTCVLKRQRRK